MGQVISAPPRRLAQRKTSWFSMGLDFADINRDGRDDFFVTDMVSRSHQMRQVQISNHRPRLFADRPDRKSPQIPRNTVFLNMGGGDFAEMRLFRGT